MNLHDLKTPFSRYAIWLRAHGRNGQYLGTHLWEIIEDQGETRPALETMPVWQNRTWWSPAYFYWRPWTTYIRGFMQHGWVLPLCGHRSRSRSPSMSLAITPNCMRCTNEAQRRNIIAGSDTDILLLHPMTAQILEERTAWENAGRPDEWQTPF